MVVQASCWVHWRAIRSVISVYIFANEQGPVFLREAEQQKMCKVYSCGSIIQFGVEEFCLG